MGFRRDAADKMKYKHYFALSVLNFCPNDNKVFCLIYCIITCSIDIDMGHSTHIPHQLNSIKLILDFKLMLNLGD